MDGGILFILMTLEETQLLEAFVSLRNIQIKVLT